MTIPQKIHRTLFLPGSYGAGMVSSREIFFITVPAGQVAHIKLFRPSAIPVFGRNAVSGAVGGGWDRLKVPFHFHYLYRAIKARIVDGVDWEETPLHKWGGREGSGEAIRKENERCDRMIETIRKEGYRSQYELGSRQGKREIGGIVLPAELVVGMDRHGRFFQLAGGRHRLAIAHVLGIAEVPAILSLFHTKGRDKLPFKRRRITGDFEDFRPF